MKKCTRGKSKGGTLVLKKSDAAFLVRVRELGGDKVGVVPVDVSKRNVCAMVADFYGNVLAEPEEFPVTAAGLAVLDRRIGEVRDRHGLKLVAVGLEQTGRLHEPVKRVLSRRWEIKMVHPLVTNHLRQGFSRGNKTDGQDLDALRRAVTSCYGRVERQLPPEHARWQALHRAREQLVDERSSLKQRMHERLQAVMPGFFGQYENIWASPAAMVLLRQYGSAAAVAEAGEDGLRRRLGECGAACSPKKAEALVAWAHDAAPVGAAAETEMEVFRGDLEQLAFLTRRIIGLETAMLGYLAQSRFVLLLGIAGVSHVLSCGLGAEAGPLEAYATCRSLTGRAGLFASRYQSDETDNTGSMAHGEPFLRDVLMKIGRCVTMSGGAFFAYGEYHRKMGWDERKISAAMANRFCRIIHTMLLSGQTFRHPDAKPAVSIIGKLLNVAADLGVPAGQASKLALDAMAWIPADSLDVEWHALQSGEWKNINRPREHGSPLATNREITQNCVPQILNHLHTRKKQHDVAQPLLIPADFRSP
jgi:transposase